LLASILRERGCDDLEKREYRNTIGKQRTEVALILVGTDLRKRSGEVKRSPIAVQRDAVA
jgi:hypothetical protein